MSLFQRPKQSVLVDRKCPSCGEPLSEHAQSDLGSAPVGSVEEARLADSIARRAWDEARTVQHANAVSDIRVWRVIHCRDGRVGIVALLMPIDMWSDNSYEEPLFLDPAEAAGLP